MNTHGQVGSECAGWLSFQPLFAKIAAKNPTCSSSVRGRCSFIRFCNARGELCALGQKRINERRPFLQRAA